MSGNEQQKIQVVVADPSALGLFGLAMVTLVAASQKLGCTTGFSFIIPWAIFLGSGAQMMASVYDFKHNNLFGATVFGAYGLFWISVAFSWMIKMGVFGAVLAAGVDAKQLGLAFVGYFIFSCFGTAAALKTTKVLLTIMFFIDLLFFGLALDTLKLGFSWAHELAAWSELTISLLSFYACGANFLNKWYGRTILPMGSALAK